MLTRAELEQREEQFLAWYAMRSSESRGRAFPEAEHAYRTAYQRDRDRITHSKTFRRLKHKTQVFLAPTGDHYRTRLQLGTAEIYVRKPVFIYISGGYFGPTGGFKMR